MTKSEPDPRWLTPKELDSWLTVVAMSQALMTALDTQLKRDAGLNHFEYFVMASLSQAPDHTLRMSRLAVLAQGSLSRLSHGVARLEKAAWVVRRPCPDDGRYTEARLTSAGYKKVQRTAPGHVIEARRLVVDALTPTELTQLTRAARAIIEQADPDIARRLDEGL